MTRNNLLHRLLPLAVTLKLSPGVMSGESLIGATIYSVIHRTFRLGPGAIFSELGDCRSGERKLGWVLYRHRAVLKVLGHSGSRVRSEVRVRVLSVGHLLAGTLKQSHWQ